MEFYPRGTGINECTACCDRTSIRSADDQVRDPIAIDIARILYIAAKTGVARVASMGPHYITSAT